jgi:hypothetical protein
MTKFKPKIVLSFAVLMAASSVAVSQSRIQLAQGKRLIQDKVSFVIEVVPEKRNDPRYATAPEDLQIFTRFMDKPVTGKAYIDGKAVGRFDEAMSFNSNLLDVTYGRHTITIALAAPSFMMDFYVTVRGGLPREILDDQEPAAVLPPGLEKRVGELEHRVHDLEDEIASLKKKRQH